MARNSRTSSRLTDSPAPKLATAAGSSAATPSGPSGRPTSVELTTSCASVPIAAPVCPPTIRPPIRRIIWPNPPRPPSPPFIADIAACSSGGMPPISPGSSVSMPPIASTARSAIGSQSLDQTGMVASTHSDRLHACTDRIPVGKLVTSSSHRSATRSASDTCCRSTSRTLGSPLAATVCRATFLARSQLTTPPCQDIRSANCRSASANCCGSPSGPSGPIGPGGPPGPPGPRPAPPEPPGTSGVLPESPGSRSRSPGRPKPKGGSVISAASQAGWKGPRPPRYPGALGGEQSRCQVRPRRSPGGLPSGHGPPVSRREPRDEPASNGGPGARGREERGRGPAVAVTGAASGLGHALTARLAASDRIGRVIAIDGHRGDATGVTWRVVDIRDPALAGRLAGVGRVVLVTSAMVYGARPDNPVPLAEEAPLGADPDGSVVGDLLEVEHLAQRSPQANPGMAITVVRPAALVGEGVDTLITRHFEAPRLLAVKGCAPRWQFCHVDDLVSALELAAAGEVTGAIAVGCDGWLEQDQVEELSGLRRIELPAAVTFATAQRLHRAGITPAPVSDLHYVVYPWVVDCKTLREAGWQPTISNTRALEVLLEQRAGHHAVAGRRLAKKDATITAAGATVAVIGTAAIVRQVRKRRRES